MQPAALRSASDVNSRTGDRRPRPRALCCTKMQLPIHPLLRLLGRRSAVPARPRPHTDHPFGLSTGSPLATGSPHLSAARRAFSSNFPITHWDAVCKLAGIRSHATTTYTQVADGPGLP